MDHRAGPSIDAGMPLQEVFDQKIEAFLLAGRGAFDCPEYAVNVLAAEPVLFGKKEFEVLVRLDPVGRVERRKPDHEGVWRREVGGIFRSVRMARHDQALSASRPGAVAVSATSVMS